MRPKISICITVYNQVDMLKDRIRNALRYQGDDIEVLISDDCSSEDIAGLIGEYSDSRLRYVRTPRNLGHDLNIIHALRNARGIYAFVFRTRDSVAAENIGILISRLVQNPQIGYMLPSAYGTMQSVRLALPDRIYSKGEESIAAALSLPEHPSGNIYKTDLLRLDVYERYITLHHSDIFAFDVHTLIRIDLARQASIATSATPGWLYVYSFSGGDRAVNSSKNGVNVYAPSFSYPRYRCVFDFANKELPEEWRPLALSLIVRNFYKMICVSFEVLNQSEENNTHYGSAELEDYSPKKERVTFVAETMRMGESTSPASRSAIAKELAYQERLSRWKYPMYNRLAVFVHRHKKLLKMWHKLKHVE